MDEKDSAVAAFLGRPMVGKYLIVAEAYNGDGEPSLIVHTSDGLSIWDELGLLHSATNRAHLIDREGWSINSSPRMNPGDSWLRPHPHPPWKEARNVLHRQHQQGTAQPCPCGNT